MESTMILQHDVLKFVTEQVNPTLGEVAENFGGLTSAFGQVIADMIEDGILVSAFDNTSGWAGELRLHIDAKYI